jgi:hypothetical protein
MSLQLISFARYLTAPGIQWTQPYYNANKVIKAVKGDEVKGFADLTLGGIPFRLDRTTALPDLSAYLAQVIVLELQESLAAPHYIVPVPNSTCTETSPHPPSVCVLANAIASCHTVTRIWDGLRWGEEMLKSSRGGTRDYQTLLNNYRSSQSVPLDAPLILLDDVATTGNHLLAAAAFLESGGAHCKLAIVVGRTVHDTSQPALGSQAEILV